MKTNLCPVCNRMFDKLMTHVHSKHPDLYASECQKALDFFENGMTLGEIAKSNLTLWGLGSALEKVIHSKFSKEDLENKRRERISQTMLTGYDENAYDLTHRGRKPKTIDIDNAIDCPFTENLTWGGQKLNKRFILGMDDKTLGHVKRSLVSYLRRCDWSKIDCSVRELLSSWGHIKDGSIQINSNTLYNSSSVGSKLYKYFFPGMLKVRGEGKPSILEAVSDETLLNKILNNRLSKSILSYNSGRITKNMILQGAKASGCAFSCSQFKPVVAKAIYDRFVKPGDTVLDYSCGFGSRLLGLMALGRNNRYFGFEPCSDTFAGLNDLIRFFNFPAQIKCIGSEDGWFDEKMDFVFSSPPYYNREIYSSEETQCYNKFPDYNEWLEKYWRGTVGRIKLMMAPNAIFGVNIGNDANDLMKKLAADFNRIVLDEGFYLHEMITMKTPVSNLANKTQRYSYKNEYIYFYKSV